MGLGVAVRVSHLVCLHGVKECISVLAIVVEVQGSIRRVNGQQRSHYIDESLVDPAARRYLGKVDHKGPASPDRDVGWVLHKRNTNCKALPTRAEAATQASQAAPMRA